MITSFHFPTHLMETLRSWSLVCGCSLFMFLTSKGSACEAPTSPECFRRNSSYSEYTCEWNMNTTDGNVRFDLYFNKTKFENIDKTWFTISEDELFLLRDVHIWVEAHVGTSSCSSPKRSVVLQDIVKYDAPHDISMSWSTNSLTWAAADEHPALAEIWIGRDGNPTESWDTRFTKNTTMTAQTFREPPTSHCPTLRKGGAARYQVTVLNLTNLSAHRVQIRQRSTQVKQPLWSNWSPVLVVPAALTHEPEVTETTKRLNGTREVTLTLKPTTYAAAAAAVAVTYTLSSHGCSCLRREKTRSHIKTNPFTIYVSYSPVNISVIAQNAAGCSPSATVQVPAEPTADLKTCDEAVDNKSRRKICKQWYELQDGDLKPKHVITLESHKKQVNRKRADLLQDYVGYLYFEHRCDGGKPRTIKRCLYYQKEGAPHGKPGDFTVLGQTHNSANLVWSAIASEDQQGFLTHYSLCSVKMGSQDEPIECHNISASSRNYSLENLTPGAKYNISLAGVTRAGAGPTAVVTLNTQEKNVNVWLSFGPLFGILLTITMCTVILKRIQNKILPPVPTPVIPDFPANQERESQEMLEGKEEVHELLLLQMHPEGQTVPQEAGESTALREEWGTGSEEDVEDQDESRMSEGSERERPGSTDQEQASSRIKELTDLEEVDNEITMLIYRNGLVFDVKADSP